MAMPRFASCNAAGQVDGHKTLTAAWITKDLRQTICLDVVIHHPLDLCQFQIICSGELECQFVYGRQSHTLDLLLDGLDSLQGMQVIEIRWFAWQIRLIEGWIHNFPKHQPCRRLRLRNARIALRKLIIVSTDHNPRPQKHLLGTLGYLG